MKIKLILYSLIPSILVFGSIEIVFRVFYSIKPQFITAPLPDELRNLAIPDDDLFWKLKPNAEVLEPNGAKVNINSLGFRGPELMAKKHTEYRILSLGESTTFGAWVENDSTYSAQIERILNENIEGPSSIQVMNCGVSAYSSFQGLKYLELFGLNFKPDMVLIYFEINDYMPATLRNYGNNETSAYSTDMQLYESRIVSTFRKVINSSRFLTYLNYRYAAWKVRQLGSGSVQNPFINIGIQNPDYTGGRLAVKRGSKMVRSGLNEYNMGQRVSEIERLKILKSFHNICEKANIPLIVIHPAYMNTNLHKCVLTEFCDKYNVPKFESFFSLHPDPDAQGLLFYDNMHPNNEGHRRLAEDLAEFIKPLIQKHKTIDKLHQQNN